MRKVVELKTDRLLLRQWKPEDYPIFSEINADPEVMKYYPRTLNSSESNALARKLETLISEQSWGFWAVELAREKQFIGFVGLNEPKYELPVNPCIEIGWRLAKEYWGKGYATEAARAALKFGFEVLELNEVYSFSSVSNQKSRAVMERLRMQNCGRNFKHPDIPENHRLSEHVLYTIVKQQMYA